MPTFNVYGLAQIGFIFAVEAADEDEAICMVQDGNVDTSDIRFPKDFEFNVQGVDAAVEEEADSEGES